MEQLIKFLFVVSVTLFSVGCGEKETVLDENNTENNEENIGNSDDPIEIPYEDLPYFCNIENTDGWTNTRISKDGTAIFTLNDKATEQVEKAFVLMSVDSLGVVPIYGEFDETGFPTYLVIGDNIIFIDNHTDTSFDASLFIDGNPVWTGTDLKLSATSRAWSDNNWVRNTCAVGGVITSSIGIGVGVFLTGTGVGAGTGLPTIGASSYALYNNLETLFGPADRQMDPFVVDLIKEHGVDYLCDNLSKSNQEYLNKYLESRFGKPLGLLKGLTLADFGLFAIDQFWGETVSDARQKLALILAHRDYKVETGVAKDVTEHTAELSGYVSPEALTPLDAYAEIEYGIVVYPTADPNNRMHKEDIVGSGGAFSLLFRGLEYDTEYSYFVYYSDKDHAIARYGATRTFKTVGEDDLRDMLIKLYHDTGGNNWTRNDNWCSDKPLDEWYGVYVYTDDAGRRKCKLELNANNLVGKADLSGCTALTRLFFDENQLTSLDVSGCTALADLDCSGNELTSLNVSGCTALEDLFCSGNQLTSLDVSGCTALNYLRCYSNQLTSLNVSGCTALNYLDCDYNQLTSLNVSGCAALEDLFCFDNQLTSLNVSGCTALEVLYCWDNQLTSLNVSGCTALEFLFCYFNQLTSLNVSGCAALKHLYCDNNQLKSLNVSGCTALEFLECDYNQLTSLNVSGCTALVILDCVNNQLKSLNVSGCAVLEDLGCSGNQLTSLNVSGCTALEYLYCSDNPITQMITEPFLSIPYFHYDRRFYYDNVGDWSYNYDDGHGWYYPGEPQKGYHGK